MDETRLGNEIESMCSEMQVMSAFKRSPTSGNVNHLCYSALVTKANKVCASKCAYMIYAQILLHTYIAHMQTLNHSLDTDQTKHPQLPLLSPNMYLQM